MDRKLSTLLEEWPLNSAARYAGYLIPDCSPHSDIARAVECSVFERFFGNTPEEMASAYGDYEEQSLFLLVVDQELKRPAGALRMIRPSARGLKTLNDIEQCLGVDPAQFARHHEVEDPWRCWDVGTLAVLKEYRGAATDHVVSLMLYGYLHHVLRASDVEHMVTILDKHAYAQLTEVLRVPFVPIAGTRPFSYLGSESSRAVYVRVQSVTPTVESYMQHLTPELHQLLRPYLARLLYCEDMPELVEVQMAERTQRFRKARLTG